VVRPLALCLSFAVILLGVVGLFSGGGVPAWMIALAFVAGGVGVALDVVAWLTGGRRSVAVALTMTALLAVLFIAGLATHVVGWMNAVVLALACAFLLLGLARVGEERWGQPIRGDL
jgi:hypothetical protein